MIGPGPPAWDIPLLSGQHTAIAFDDVISKLSCGAVIGGISVAKEGAGARVGTKRSLHAAHSAAGSKACKWLSFSLTCGLPYHCQIWDGCKVEAMESASMSFCSKKLLRCTCVIFIISESGKYTVGALARAEYMMSATYM